MKAHFGMIGLGTMGRNFLLNIAEHGIRSIGYDLDSAKRELLLKEGSGMPVDVGSDLADFLAKLESPRNIMLLVPAGPIVDKVIADLVPHLEKDDLIIDGGNSHFTDTERRERRFVMRKTLVSWALAFAAAKKARVTERRSCPAAAEIFTTASKKRLQAVSAKVNGEPCVAYMGAGSAGPFRQDGSQRHRIRHDAAHRRDIRFHAACPADGKYRDAPDFC